MAFLKREYATEDGTVLNATLTKMSLLNPQFKAKKQTVFQKVTAFVEKFKGASWDRMSQLHLGVLNYERLEHRLEKTC